MKSNLKPNWNHWIKLAEATGPFPTNPALHKKKENEDSGWQKISEKAKKMLRNAASKRGLVFKIAYRGQYAFHDRKTKERVGRLATLKQHYEHLPNYYINEDKQDG